MELNSTTFQHLLLIHLTIRFTTGYLCNFGRWRATYGWRKLEKYFIANDFSCCIGFVADAVWVRTATRIPQLRTRNINAGCIDTWIYCDIWEFCYDVTSQHASLFEIY